MSYNGTDLGNLNALKSFGTRAKDFANNLFNQLTTAVTNAVTEIHRVKATKPLPVTVTILATGWTLDSNETSDYKYYYDITVDGVDSTDIATVIVSRASFSIAEAAGICPENETLVVNEVGRIRLRSINVPTDNITATYWIFNSLNVANS